MECRFDRDMIIPLSLCDNKGKLSVHSIFTVFMDLAAEHAEIIGLGADKMAQKGMFWLTAKTKIHITERPSMISRVMASTWPEAPGRVRCNRYYSLKDQDRIYAEGVTEWAVIDINSGKLCKASDIYMQDTVFSTQKANVAPFEKISEDFSQEEKLGVYRISSSDIDLGQHMNNAAYVRALLGAIPYGELGSLNITDAEVAFKHPCYEGTELAIFRRNTDTGFDMAMQLPDGQVAVAARFKTK